MNDDQRRLYRALGFSGPLPGDELPLSFNEVGEAVMEETPPLDEAGLDRLEEMLNSEPRKTISRVREIWDRRMTGKRLRKAIAQARRALQDPNEVIAEIEARNAVASFSATSLPPDFHFPGMDPNIEIKPDDRKYENDDLIGILGWVFGAGPFVLTQGARNDFRFHDQSRRFIYQMEEPSPAKPLDIAIFSDFGVGRYYSDYMAKQFRENRYSYAIHLGDVYYAGRASEFRDNLEKQIDPILGFTRFFSLNANHEMYSGAKPYFDYIDRRSTHASAIQQQQASYFCLRSEQFQIVGIDTAFFGHGRYRESQLIEWLGDILREGRRTNRLNILLSHDHPYEYGEKKLTKLSRKDLKQLALDERLIDLWFWGNTHYGALFDHKPAPSKEIPALHFVGGCLGHGGYPYDTKIRGKFEPAPMIFLEDQSRFPGTNVRPDKGNNGYCALRLKADGSIELRYIDWMSNLRFAASLKRGPQGAPLLVAPIAER